MSDLISKKALILQALAQPGGSERSNPSIAAEVGCDGKLVRSVRAELETETLRSRVAELEAALATHKADCHCHDAATEKQTAPVQPVRRRKVRVESYPLFETAS